MGCGVGGTNHLRRGTYGAKDAHPYCGEGQLGYMWDRNVFDIKVSEGCACQACIRTLELEASEEKCADLAAIVHNLQADAILLRNQIEVIEQQLDTIRIAANKMSGGV